MEKINYKGFDIQPLKFSAPTKSYETFHIHDYDSVQDLVNELQHKGIPLNEVKHHWLSFGPSVDEVSCFIYERPIAKSDLTAVNQIKLEREKGYIESCKDLIDQYVIQQKEYDDAEGRGFSITLYERVHLFKTLKENLSEFHRRYQYEINKLYNK